MNNSRRRRTPLPPTRSSSSLSAPLAAALFHNTCRAPCPSSAGDVVVACTRPQESAARSRSREQGASSFARLPRSLAPPATSPRGSPQLRFVPVDPVAHVVRKAQEACSCAQKDEQFAREAANGAPSSSRTCLVLSLLPLRAARRSSASSPPSYSSQQRGRHRNCARSPQGRAACPRSSDCPIILHSPPFALSLDELPLRAARRISTSSPSTPSPRSREKRRRRARLPLLTCCSPRVTVRWFAKQLNRPALAPGAIACK